MNLSISRNSNEDAEILTAAVKSIWPNAKLVDNYESHGTVLAAWRLSNEGETAEYLALLGFQPHFNLIHRSLTRGSLTFGRTTLEYYRGNNSLSFTQQNVTLPETISTSNFATLVKTFHQELLTGLGALA